MAGGVVKVYSFVLPCQANVSPILSPVVNQANKKAPGRLACCWGWFMEAIDSGIGCQATATLAVLPNVRTSRSPQCLHASNHRVSPVT